VFVAECAAQVITQTSAEPHRMSVFLDRTVLLCFRDTIYPRTRGLQFTLPGEAGNTLQPGSSYTERNTFFQLNSGNHAKLPINQRQHKVQTNHSVKDVLLKLHLQLLERPIRFIPTVLGPSIVVHSSQRVLVRWAPVLFPVPQASALLWGVGRVPRTATASSSACFCYFISFRVLFLDSRLLGVSAGARPIAKFPRSSFAIKRSMSAIFRLSLSWPALPRSNFCYH
jgi:hypothetical protein